jgi:hypothetical protein
VRTGQHEDVNSQIDAEDASSPPIAAREPPQWIPVAAVVSAPSTLALVGIGSAFSDALAIIALLVGVMTFLLLVGWWAMPNLPGAFIKLTVVAIGGAVTVVAAVVGLTALADRTPGIGPVDSTSQSTAATTDPVSTSSTP